MHGFLNTGDIIEMSVANLNMTAGTAVPNLPPIFKAFSATGQQLAAPVLPTGLPKVTTGINATAQRNFVWLPYHPGFLTLVPFGALPVFTGWMSGCWIALVTIAGRAHVLHVGTDTSPASANTINVKNAIKIAIGTKAVTMVKAWQPASGTGQTIACVASDRSFHDYGMQTTPNPAGGPMGLKVMSIKAVTGQPGLPQGY
jgi:hypothetical protein